MSAPRSNGLRAILLLAATTFLSAPAARADDAATLAALAPDLSRAAINEAATLAALAPDLSRAAINEALTAVRCAKAKGVATDADRLAIVDYTRSSQERRLWIFDLQQKKVLFQEFVAHGKNSGEDIPTDFSNRNGSHQTSLGLFLADETYEGGNGYSLKLLGLSGPLNDLAFERKIVMHGADYVDPDKAREVGRLGRSFGCPSVRPVVARPIIDTLKEGQLLYAYGPGSAVAKNCETLALVTRGEREAAGRGGRR